jgi:hypothetical protein
LVEKTARLFVAGAFVASTPRSELRGSQIEHHVSLSAVVGYVVVHPTSNEANVIDSPCWC